MNERCDRCESWVPYKPETYSRPDGSTYTIEAQHPGWGRCERGNTDSSQPEDDSTLFCGQDSEGYVGWVDTKPEFGCVMFNQRQEAQRVAGE